MRDIIQHLNTKNPKPGLVVIPTGGGKSWCIADLIDKMGSPATLVLQPTRELLKQNYSKFTGPEIGGKASMYSASMNTKEVGNVTYATPMSLKGKAELFQHVELVIFDEAHLKTTPRKSGKRINRGQVYRFLSKLPKTVKVVGFTATPLTLQVKGNRFDNYHQLSILTRITPRFWSKIIHVTQMKGLYDNKYLSPLRFTSFDRGMRNAKSRGSDFDMEDVRLINQRSDVIPFTADLINESIKRGKKKILVFTPTVEEAYELQKLVPSEVIASGTKSEERENIIESFVEGDLKVLTNFGTLTEGFDCPEIDLIICMRPTKSYALWYQIVGRGIRIGEGKDLCDVVDLSGNYLEFGDPKDLEIRDDQSTKGWAMFVKNKVITGVPIHQEGKKELQKSSPILKNIITFGKHKGRKWVDVPDSYSRFLADKGDLNTKWAEENIKPYLRALGLIQ